MLEDSHGREWKLENVEYERGDRLHVIFNTNGTKESADDTIVTVIKKHGKAF